MTKIYCHLQINVIICLFIYLRQNFNTSIKIISSKHKNHNLNNRLIISTFEKTHLFLQLSLSTARGDSHTNELEKKGFIAIFESRVDRAFLFAGISRYIASYYPNGFISQAQEN